MFHICWQAKNLVSSYNKLFFAKDEKLIQILKFFELK